MTNKLEVPLYISSSSYFFEEEKSRCYINDDKSHRELMLEGVWADLWYIILKTQNLKKVREYAKLKNLDEYFDEFFEELQYTGLIKPDNLEKTNKIYPQRYEENQTSAEDYERYFFEKKNWIYKNGFLYSLVMELSYKCNLACKHCFMDKDSLEHSINYASAKKIIDEAIKLGVSHFCFTSGECTIHPDLIKILSYIRKKRKTFTIITNGQALYDDEDLFESLIQLYPHEIRVSLYSMDPKIHDYITGVKGSHKKTVEVIKKLCSRNVKVRINYFQMSLNKNCLDDVLKFREEVNADLTVSNFYFINNKKNNNLYTMIGDKEIYEALDNKNSPYYYLLDVKNNLYNKEAPLCFGICGSVGISPSLDVFPCIALKYKLGNLTETTLESIFNNQYKNFIAIFKRENLIDCKNCKDSQYCLYQPCMGMYENGFLRKSDICCKVTKIRIDILKSKGLYHKNLT